MNERLPDTTQNGIQTGVRVRVMVFNATFNNFSAISWWSVLLVEETIVDIHVLSLD
jgi:hypothetical protein